MGNEESVGFGRIVWTDLTVEGASEVREFYKEVVGWGDSPVEMGEYQDFNMHATPGGDVVAGICHARGSNAQIPPQWMIYITVEDVVRSARRCAELGGKVLLPPRALGAHGTFCIIQDPAGAVAGLITPAS